MLHLPCPYPDELVGSMLERGQRILGKSRVEFLSRLTGSAGVRSHSHLITMYEKVARTYGMAFNAFVMQHTVLPYLMAFMKAHRREQLLRHLQEVRGNYGPLANRAIVGEKWMRRCPECVAAELHKYGESYWHRVHQLSAVHICVHHRVKLEWTTQALGQGVEVALPHESTLQPEPQTIDLPSEFMWEIALASANALWSQEGESAKLEYLDGHCTPQLASTLEQAFGIRFLQRYGCCLIGTAVSVWPLKSLDIPIHDTSSLLQILIRVLMQRGDAEDLAAFVILPAPRKTKPSSTRDWCAVEQYAIEILTTEVEHHAKQGTQVRLKDLYALAGCEFLKHGIKHQMPRLMAWIENFKRSPQSVRLSGGRRKK